MNRPNARGIRRIHRNSHSNGRTALMHAACGGYKEIVQALIDNGADINAQDDKKNTAMTLAQKKGRTEIMETLKSAKTTFR